MFLGSVNPQDLSIPGMANEAKKLQEKLSKSEKASTATNSTPKSKKNCATAGNKRLVTLKSELANTLAAHTHLIYVLARAEEATHKAQTRLRDSQMHFFRSLRRPRGVMKL